MYGERKPRIMKKRLVLCIFILGMVKIAAAQQLSIAINQGDTIAKVSGIPTGYTLVYFEKEESSNKKSISKYYVVIRPVLKPQESIDYGKFRLFSGTEAGMSEVTDNTFHYDDGDLTVKNQEIELSLSRYAEGTVTTKEGSIPLKKILH
jgi:hypothetical protein